jgi:GNAT superfamily N-acetyltransferase
MQIVFYRRGRLNHAIKQAFARLACVVSCMVLHSGDDTNVASVECLQVSARHRRQGIATDQLRYAAEVFQPRFVKILFVAVHNTIGIALYRNCGWGLVGGALSQDMEDCRPSEEDHFVYECRQLGAPV